jgi:hypothetical protein
MKVSQLIEELGFMDPNAEVHFSYNYGDHWRTKVAPKVGRVDEDAVVYSNYHRMDKMVEDDGDYIEDVRKVVVIS